MNNNFILNTFYYKMKVNNNINNRIKKKYLFHIIILTKKSENGKRLYIQKS